MRRLHCLKTSLYLDNKVKIYAIYAVSHHIAAGSTSNLGNPLGETGEERRGGGDSELYEIGFSVILAI